jgi:hypothetical protein
MEAKYSLCHIVPGLVAGIDEFDVFPDSLLRNLFSVPIGNLVTQTTSHPHGPGRF